MILSVLFSCLLFNSET